MAVFMAILSMTCFSWGKVTGLQLERPAEQALANVTQTDQRALLLRMKAHGFAATGQQSAYDLSAQYGVGVNRLLGLVFLPEKIAASSSPKGQSEH